MFNRIHEEIDFSAGPAPKPREERSNAGTHALAMATLVDIMGLSQDGADKVMDMIANMGEASSVQRSLKLLPLAAHSRLNQILDAVSSKDPAVDGDDMDDDEFDNMVDQADGYDDNVDNTSPDEDPDELDGDEYQPDDMDDESEWTPDEDRSDTEDYMDNQNDVDPVADPDDYEMSARKTPGATDMPPVKESFIKFLMNEQDDINSSLISALSSDDDDSLDANDKAKIDQLTKSGNEAGAQRIRDAAKKKNKSTPIAPSQKTVGQRNVDQAKNQLATAIERRAAEKKAGR